MVTVASEILQTKLTPPPVRAGRVARPRLTQRFSAGLERPFTLVCAPAGYGKSTLLSEWLDSDVSKGVRFAWLSLDEDDNDSTRFLTYLVSALVGVGGFDADELLSLLRSPQPPLAKVVLTALVSRLEASAEPFALVLDDYHFISAQTIHEAMTFLLDHLPAQMRLVIISREDPPFPLARLRGRGLLTEIRVDDLRFTQAEAAAFFQQTLGIALTGQQIAELDTRTEGWVAGLQLAALAMSGREDVAGFIAAFTGSHRYVLDYLTEEVLSRQPEHLQAFLLQTSILSRLSSALCDAVTGRGDGQAVLEQIEHENLFLIPLDDERNWYRYHPLFAEMLRNRLKQSGSVDELHRRASQWLAEARLYDEAVSHAIIARDYELAACIMEDSGSRYFVESWDNFGVKWAAQIPYEVMAQHPLLALNTGMWHSYLGRAELAQKHVEAARAGLTGTTLTLADQQELLGYADTIEALSATINYDSQRAIAAAESALQRLPEHRVRLRGTALLVKGYVYQRERRLDEAQVIYADVIEIGQELRDLNMMTRAMLHNAEIFLLRGQLNRAEAAYRTLIQTAKDAKQEHLLNVGITYGELSIVLFERNRLEEAEQLAALSVERCAPIIPYYAMVGYAILARIHRLTGDDAACQRAVRSILDILEGYPSIPARVYILFVTRLWLPDDVFAVFRRYLMAQRHQPTTEFEDLLLYLVAIRGLIEPGNTATLDEALRQLDDLQPLLTKVGSTTCRIIALVLEALALDSLKRTPEALERLTHALELAEPEDFMRLFADEGEPMALLLRSVRSRGAHVDYVDKLLGALEGTARPSPALTLPTDSLIEPLSERELEVLRLIADGASNREVAEALYVSIGTVKKHLNNIFLKLDVHSRTQLITRAREYHFI